MKKFLLLMVLLCLMSNGWLRAADAVLPLRVLYIGHRAAEFTPLLKEHFATVDAVARDQFKPAQAARFDVVLLDWPQSGTMQGAWLAGSPLGRREDWKKPAVLLGSAGLNLAVAWKLHGGSGCTCLAPVAYNLRPHPIFQGPMPVDIHATIDIPTPEPFAHELKTNATIAVLPLVDNIRSYRTVIDDNARGWSSHYYEFADMPDVEVFSGGINEQTPRSAAFWRQGNLLHFGFEQSPAQLNAAGRAMLVDAVAYISHFTQDRPIDVTLSVFGPDQIALTRSRAKGYLMNYPAAVPKYFSAAALASFKWNDPHPALSGDYPYATMKMENRHDTNAAVVWFNAERSWIYPNAANLLEVDAEAQALNVPFDSTNFFPMTIAALRNEPTKSAAATLLARYAPEGPGAGADAETWSHWWQENSPYLFYSELGGYRWYIDPLAKARGVPSKDLRGSLRADRS